MTRNKLAQFDYLPFIRDISSALFRIIGEIQAVLVRRPLLARGLLLQGNYPAT
ncbi:hypothetical protein ARMSODRAFT_946556 [Armillaria solidipes]|uniref:Uncharacterized protein n=1 Tax=Armillaria solidipes TaxID=1076256 RepID=A0A2H3CQY8_9AGAR|nr:hypothetical protein ARMSODRAFT_946556 [Armillaria solidipes]